MKEYFMIHKKRLLHIVCFILLMFIPFIACEIFDYFIIRIPAWAIFIITTNYIFWFIVP
jgi:hypothetical protein